MFNPSPDELRAARDYLLSARDEAPPAEPMRSAPRLAATGLRARLRRLRQEDNHPAGMRSAS